MNLYPLKFKPIYKELIWGGHKLANILEKDFPKDKKIGESWELVDLPSDKSQIENLMGWLNRLFALEDYIESL